MTETLRPETPEQVRDVLAWAAGEETPLVVEGGGSKRPFGRPVQAAHTLDLSALSGIALYEPEELVLSAGAGTPMTEIEAALDAKAQQLAFEPPDLSGLLGTEGAGTLGGALACNLAGPRRIKAGAARDHFLGVEAVSGRGETFKSGGRVMKNVSGYDMCKLLTGAFGTLAAMTKVTVKVLPAPEKTRTLLLMGLDDAAATRAMTAALNSPHDISGAAHLPAALAGRSGVSYVADAGEAVTALRLEGVAPSVEARMTALREALAPFGALEELHGANSGGFWREVRDVAPFHGDARPVWRLSVAPQAGHRVVADVRREIDAEALYDWGGGLVWLALPADGPAAADAGADIVRSALVNGGHATLVRAAEPVRAAVDVFQPQPPPLAALTRRVKDSFDPRGVLNPGRMYPDV